MGNIRGQKSQRTNYSYGLDPSFILEFGVDNFFSFR